MNLRIELRPCSPRRVAVGRRANQNILKCLYWRQAIKCAIGPRELAESVVIWEASVYKDLNII